MERISTRLKTLLVNSNLKWWGLRGVLNKVTQSASLMFPNHSPVYLSVSLFTPMPLEKTNTTVKKMTYSLDCPFSTAFNNWLPVHASQYDFFPSIHFYTFLCFFFYRSIFFWSLPVSGHNSVKTAASCQHIAFLHAIHSLPFVLFIILLLSSPLPDLFGSVATGQARLSQNGRMPSWLRSSLHDSPKRTKLFHALCLWGMCLLMS